MKKKVTKIKEITDSPIAVFNLGDCIGMLRRRGESKKSLLYLSTSSDGFNLFEEVKEKVSLKGKDKKEENISDCSNFSVSVTSKGFIMSYFKKTKTGNKIIIVLSKDGLTWNYKSEIDAEDSLKISILYNDELERFDLFRDGLFVKRQSSKNLSKWTSPELLFTSRGGKFDEEPISLVGTMKTSKGYFIVYDSSIYHKNKILLQTGGVLVDSKDFGKILWRGEDPLIQSILETHNRSTKIIPLGFSVSGEKINAYWSDGLGSIIIISTPLVFKDVFIPYIKTASILSRCSSNPILKPKLHNNWESEAVFNPAVFSDEDGVLHILYRAIGGDGVSRVGYAQSNDGVSFIKRLDHPVFEPSMGFGIPNKKTHKEPMVYHPSYYTSGGGWGGAEDPRVVKIDDRIYMTYVAFEGWYSIRMAITSISNDDFKKGIWRWKKPVLISPPGEIHKNWVLFPEKIKGKYAILHGISPKILIDYIDELEDFNESNYIRSAPPKGGRDINWDNKVRGAGSPPIRTEMGWLLLYHAMDKYDPNKYKIGAMILDINDPTKILYRSSNPILSPDMDYENDGKPGVVYNSGAVLKGEDLLIYYGGADKVVCVATTKIKDLLDYLVNAPAETYSLKKISGRML